LTFSFANFLIDAIIIHPVKYAFNNISSAAVTVYVSQRSHAVISKKSRCLGPISEKKLSADFSAIF
jgi:hypothetical protein